MTKPFAPMLAATCDDIETLRYPVLASPKLDGIRCIIKDGIAVSRKLKPIPNQFIQEKLKGLPDGLDGELIVGLPTGADCMNRATSGVMSRDGEPDFTYWVFDYLDRYALENSESFTQRFAGVMGTSLNKHRARPVPHDLVRDAAELAAIEHNYVRLGYEGVMVRDPNGLYKFGRSTAKEGGLLKIKRWHDAEALVIGVVELTTNNNEATLDALGHTKRSTHKANKVGVGAMGTLVCQTEDGVEFEIGTGFTQEQREVFWAGSSSLIGRVVTYRYRGLTPDGVPRHSSFKGWRED